MAYSAIKMGFFDKKNGKVKNREMKWFGEDSPFNKPEFTGGGATTRFPECTPSSVFYNGNIKNGMPEGQGDYSASLRKDGMPISNSSYFYFGEFKNGLKEGKGNFNSGHNGPFSGITYDGYFSENLRHGFGTFSTYLIYDHNFTKAPFKIDDVRIEYVGDWFMGKRQGVGKQTWTYENGYISSYEGQWQDDLFHGIGKCISSLGRWEYEGEFEKGKKTGNGITTILSPINPSQGM